VKRLVNTYDLVVIGAGPAGSMAARVAAQYGLKVLVLEQRRTVGYPSHCAGGILSLILDRMGVRSIVNNSIRALIENIRLFSPSGEQASQSFRKSIGYIVDRPSFDQLLMNDAQQKGAELQTQTRAIGLEGDKYSFNQVVVKSKTEIQKIKTRMIIGADGIASNIAKWAGISVSRKYLGIGFGYNAQNVKDILPNTVEIYFISHLPGGYAWIFPQGAEMANIGVGGYNDGTYMRKVFEFFRRKHPIASTKLRDARLIEYTGGIVPGSKVPLKTTFNYGMIAGDAANQVDYLTGEGIRLALISGDLAGKVAVSAFRTGDFSLIHNYHKLMQKTLFLELFASYILRHFLLHCYESDYDNFIHAISKINLNLLFDKRKWIPLFLQGILKSPSVIKIVRNTFRSLPSHVKLNLFSSYRTKPPISEFG